MKPHLLILLLLAGLSMSAQELKRSQGLLILSSGRNEAAFDLFLPCKIDTTLSLKENIEKLSGGTAFLASIEEVANEEDILLEGTKLKNEALDSKIDDDLEYVIVIPVEIGYKGEANPTFARNEKNSYLDWPVKLYRKTLFSFYNAKQFFIREVRTLLLKKDSD